MVQHSFQKPSQSGEVVELTTTSVTKCHVVLSCGGALMHEEISKHARLLDEVEDLCQCITVSELQQPGAERRAGVIHGSSNWLLLCVLLLLPLQRQ